MGAAGSKLPAQESSSCFIPPEIVEEILLNLPLKSLLRFSTVSKSWKSMIFDLGFITRHRTRAALPGRERVLISHEPSGYLTPAASTFPLSSISSNEAVDDAATPLIFPFLIHNFSSDIRLLASCGELRCVKHKRSYFLWNPSMGTYKKLPHPSTKMGSLNHLFEFYLGLGYDSVGDDYKILKMSRTTSPELYSLRSDSWKNIPSLPKKIGNWKYVFAGGELYWVSSADDASVILASFDLSSEKYAEVAQPPYDPVLTFNNDGVMLTVIRGKLCLHVNYGNINKYVLWVMEDCEGGNKSWIKMLDIDYCRVDPYTQWSLDEDGKNIPQNVYRCYYDEYTSGDLYVESLVSPATYCSSRPRPRKTQPTAVAVRCKQSWNRIRALFIWLWSFILYYADILS
ncbi:hypothetical protein C2S53_020484 [Perilla frutescens var. hirtella]|uniref:F-box domain-containing protein n=1 Tax=Perilla frutescens var. hirtella TaxID=608512 RepID=A0AAD4JI38_PERFH|nr:hypothetical protein C2S53_020484 [Perilla frutescens var. hirtella]